MKKIKAFFKRAWAWIKNHIVMILIIFIIIAIIVALYLIFSIFFGSKDSGISGVVTFDGKKVNVYETVDESLTNSISSDAGLKELKVKGKNAKVKATIGNSKLEVSQKNKKTFELDFSELSDKENVLIEIKRGGDGTLTEEKLRHTVETYYLTVCVDNPNAPANQTYKTLGLPTGKVYFDEDCYDTFASEIEANIYAQNEDLVIPTYMVTDGLPLRAEPSEDTARIWVKVVMVDSEPIVPDGNTRLNQDSGWAGIIDVSNYANHQVTLMLKYENNSALVNGYQYVSFYVPDFEAPELEYLPPVVDYSE